MNNTNCKSQLKTPVKPCFQPHLYCFLSIFLCLKHTRETIVWKIYIEFEAVYSTLILLQLTKALIVQPLQCFLMDISAFARGQTRVLKLCLSLPTGLKSLLTFCPIWAELRLVWLMNTQCVVICQPSTSFHECFIIMYQAYLSLTCQNYLWLDHVSLESHWKMKNNWDIKYANQPIADVSSLKVCRLNSLSDNLFSWSSLLHRTMASSLCKTIRYKRD